jgi:hypothetical protein
MGSTLYHMLPSIEALTVFQHHAMSAANSSTSHLSTAASLQVRESHECTPLAAVLSTGYGPGHASRLQQHFHDQVVSNHQLATLLPESCDTRCDNAQLGQSTADPTIHVKRLVNLETTGSATVMRHQLIIKQSGTT